MTKRKSMVGLFAVLAVATLTGCQGFLGLDYDTKHYLVGSAFEVRGQALAGIAQGDGKYEIVIGKKGDHLAAWVERDGKFVNRSIDVRRFFPNPYWPLSKPVATKRGTPESLGLLSDVGPSRSHRWLLSVQERHRVVGMYYAAVGMWGSDSVVIASNQTDDYWLELTLNGKTYYDPCRGVYRYHYQGYNPHGRGYVEQWRGSFAQYEALAKSEASDPEEVAKCRREATASLEALRPWYWMKKPLVVSPK